MWKKKADTFKKRGAPRAVPYPKSHFLEINLQSPPFSLLEASSGVHDESKAQVYLISRDRVPDVCLSNSEVEDLSLSFWAITMLSSA